MLRPRDVGNERLRCLVTFTNRTCSWTAIAGSPQHSHGDAREVRVDVPKDPEGIRSNAVNLAHKIHTFFVPDSLSDR